MAKRLSEKILVSFEQSHLISQMNSFLIELRYPTGKKQQLTVESKWEAEFSI